MYKPIKFITKIVYRDFSTYYLYCRDIKTLLPIEYGENSVFPSALDTLKRVIFALGGKLNHLKIYKYRQDNFYTYLNLGKDEKKLDISVGFKDGIDIAREFKLPIYVKEEIIKEVGVEITKELVQKALSNNYLERY